MTTSTSVERRRAFTRLALLLLGTTLCSGTAIPAWGQTAVTAQAYASAPADHLLVTPSGVDLRSGRYNYNHVDLSIGGEADAGLQLTRLPRSGFQDHSQPFANFDHNFDIMIAEKRVDIAHGYYSNGSGNDYRVFARFGARSETFDGEAIKSTFARTSQGSMSWLTYTGDRSSASVVYTFRTVEGKTAIFRPMGSGDCSQYLRCAYVSEINDPDGTKLSFEYDQAGSGGLNSTRLRSVTNSRGYALLLEYGRSDAPKVVTKACVLNLSRQVKPADNTCPAGASATSTYTYETHGELVLATSTDSDGATSGYHYGTAGGSSTIGFVKPITTSPWLTNTYRYVGTEDDSHDVVDFQQLADGRIYSFAYANSEEQTSGTVHQIAGGAVTDSQGHKISAVYGFPRFPKELMPGYDPSNPDTFPNPAGPDAPPGSGTLPVYQVTPGPVSVTDELGSTTTYDYCDPVVAAGLPASANDRCVVVPLLSYTDPENIKTDVTFGSNGLISHILRHPKPGSSLSPVDATIPYDCSITSNQCTRPLYVVDANHNVTNFGYTGFGAPAWELQAPPTSGAARPLKLYSYVQRYAFVQSASSSSLVPGSSPVWLLQTETQCQTVAGVGPGQPSPSPACDANAPQVVTAYEYGPDSTADNLLLRSKVVTADGQNLRTCYRYDPTGNKIAETSPRAGLKSCP